MLASSRSLLGPIGTSAGDEEGEFECLARMDPIPECTLIIRTVLRDDEAELGLERGLVFDNPDKPRCPLSPVRQSTVSKDAESPIGVAVPADMKLET